jgi:Bacteriophage Sf6, terminase small subunit-like
MASTTTHSKPMARPVRQSASQFRSDLTVVFAPPLHAVPLILRQQYARALQAHALAEETWEIVDEARDGTTEEIQAARLRFDQRRWMAGKLLPKVYGDKLLHTGADGEGPVEVKLALDRCSSGSRACSTTSGALYLGMDVPSLIAIATDSTGQIIGGLFIHLDRHGHKLAMAEAHARPTAKGRPSSACAGCARQCRLEGANDPDRRQPTDRACASPLAGHEAGRRHRGRQARDVSTC